jgi:predicted PurR-regulated permease PerM
MRGWIDRRTVSVLFTIGVTAGFIALLYAARHTVMALIFALWFAYLLEPAVGMMQKRFGGSRGRAVAATYLSLFVAFGIVCLTVGPRVVNEAQKLGSTLPSLINNVTSGQIAWSVGDQHHWSYSTRAYLQQFLVSHRDNILRLSATIETRLAELLSNIAWAVVVPILAVFFLLEGSGLSSSLVELIEASDQRRFLRHVLSDLDSMFAQYIRAQLYLSLLAAAAYTLFLFIIQLPYAFVIGPIAGILEFIPLAGPLMAGVLMLAIAFTTGYSHWLIIVVFWLVWRGIQDYVIMPHFMGSKLELHPLLAIAAILLGGEVGGVIGIFLSIPAVATVRVIWRNSVGEKRSRRSTKTDHQEQDAA